jgi:hypothetical protein
VNGCDWTRRERCGDRKRAREKERETYVYDEKLVDVVWRRAIAVGWCRSRRQPEAAEGVG